MKTFTSRKRNIGLAAGALWLIAISFVFVAWSLLAIGTLTSIYVLVVTFVLLCILVVTGVLVIRATLDLPKNIAQPTPEEKLIGRRFALVVSVEVIAFAVVNLFIGLTRKFELIPSLNLIIVGIHFIPLAKIFRVPRYYITGLFFCVIPIITLLAIPKQLIIGQTIAWYVVPSLGCGFVASLTAVAGLHEAWQSISKIRNAT